GFPEEPAILNRAYKGKILSTNANQNTSYEMMVAAIKKYDRTAGEQGLYDDYLTFLKNEGKQYFKRTPIHRSPRELQNLGLQIFDEASDMVSNPRIYPTP